MASIGFSRATPVCSSTQGSVIKVLSVIWTVHLSVWPTVIIKGVTLWGRPRTLSTRQSLSACFSVPLEKTRPDHLEHQKKPFQFLRSETPLIQMKCKITSLEWYLGMSLSYLQVTDWTECELLPLYPPWLHLLSQPWLLVSLNRQIKRRSSKWTCKQTHP